MPLTKSPLSKYSHLVGTNLGGGEHNWVHGKQYVILNHISTHNKTLKSESVGLAGEKTVTMCSVPKWSFLHQGALRTFQLGEQNLLSGQKPCSVSMLSLHLAQFDPKIGFRMIKEIDGIHRLSSQMCLLSIWPSPSDRHIMDPRSCPVAKIREYRLGIPVYQQKPD